MCLADDGATNGSGAFQTNFGYVQKFFNKEKFMRSLFVLILSILALGIALPGSAEVKLPEVFASNMVLQRDIPAPIWGWAEPGESVTVIFEKQSKTAETGSDGKWSLTLDPLKANTTPQVLQVKGKNTVRLENVLIGDIWLCSGQSNMEWSMNALPDTREDIPNANNTNIRLFHVEKALSTYPKDSLKANWAVCSPDSVRHFSAVGYYFGKKLQAETGVPIGLINSSWGGTRIEPWTPSIGFKGIDSLGYIVRELEVKDPKSTAYKTAAAKAIADYKKWLSESEKNLADSNPIDPPPAFPGSIKPYDNPQQPTVLHNAMVNPFVPLAMRGVIWYQGESNRGEGMLYADKMQALIKGWRTVFNNEDLGFYFVQLAPYNYGNSPEALPEIWEAQAAIEKTVPKTGMAIINDIGNLGDIHPGNKSIVGERLALLALNRTYGKTEVVCASPEMKDMKLEGNTLVLEFKNAKSLKTRDGKSPDWFEVAGGDGVFHKASAKIEGIKIILESPEVKKPYAVRFAWHMLAEPNLQNEAGLQLGAFRAGEIPEREMLDSLVPDAKKYELLYSFDPCSPKLADNQRRFVYRTDRCKEIRGKVKSVGYFIYLKPKSGGEQYLFVTMPPLDQDLTKLGVPVKSTGVRHQKNVSNVNVFSNVPGLETGTFAEGCNVEFWDCNYAVENAGNVSGASDTKYDFGDAMATGNSPGYGSMQVHNFAKKQTIFSFSGFNKGGNADIGIGNSPGEHPDWTFSNSASTLNGAQFLILVETE